MWGADGAGPGAWPERQWDVALSFAGAQRDYVRQVAEALKARGVSCFYDADEQPALWGRFLAEELPAIYGEQAAAVVMFVSAEYAARDWTGSSAGPRLTRRCGSGGVACSSLAPIPWLSGSPRSLRICGACCQA